MTDTHAALGPQSFSIEAIMRVAQQLPVEQIRRLAEAARQSSPRDDARRSALSLDPVRVAPVVLYLKQETATAFPALRATLRNGDARLDKHTSSTSLAHTFLAGVVTVALALALALAAIVNPNLWIASATLATGGAACLLGAVAAIVRRVQREERALAQMGQRAWLAVLDTAVAVALLDLCSPAATWDSAAYRTLSRPWAEVIMAVPLNPAPHPARGTTHPTPTPAQL